jgi:GT2 family glycosyltransferase
MLASKAPRQALAVLSTVAKAGLKRGWRAALDEFRLAAHKVLNLQDYFGWVRAYDTPDERELAAQRRIARRLSRRPLISIVMPVCDPPESVLIEAIASVREQTYEKWQLCIADDASREPHVGEILAEFEADDERVRVIRRIERGHISRASNDALALAHGEFVVFLDHDDTLSPQALFRLVEFLNDHPRVRLAYSDEDKLDVVGLRIDPYFKPDWDPELFRGQNYLCHVVMCERQLIDSVGRLRPGYEGAQDYDLWLRCVEQLAADEIGHVPRVLYHWRVGAGSTARALGEKSYAEDAGRRALEDHVRRTGVNAVVDSVPGGHYRVKRLVPNPAPSVAIVIPTRDRVALVRQCVESIRRLTTYPNYRVVVVDNQSREPKTRAWFEAVRAEGVQVLPYDLPFNFSALNNHAVRQLNDDIVVLLNNDIEVITPTWLEELVSHAARTEIGCVGAMLYYPNDTIQHGGVIVGTGGVAGHAYLHHARGTHGYFNRAKLVQSLSAVTGACLAVRRSVYLEVGGLDETLTVAFNDIDFCLRVRECGYRNIWTPFAELYHHESASRGHEDSPAKVKRFNSEVDRMIARWGMRLKRDPAYNLNLSLVTEPFTLSPTGPRWSDYDDEPARDVRVPARAVTRASR